MPRAHHARSVRRAAWLAASGASAVLLAACGGGNDDGVATCDESQVRQAFAAVSDTQVVMVRPFMQNEPLLLSGTATGTTPRAEADLCMVKLLVGPGSAGPAGAPSSSAGIGIEAWLPRPEKWNGRLHLKGGGGWAGGAHASTTALGVNTSGTAGSPAATAALEGAVSASTDTGHAITGTGSFAMNPDGSPNTTLWRDFAERGIHEMAVKTRFLARAFYGRDARFAYFNGFSTGGRQGLKEAQVHPGDFDGILAGAPAIHWTKFITTELYPQIVIQRDLGGVPLTADQHTLVSTAAVNACDLVGGVHLGYVPDPSTCRYDPTQDPGVLCASAGGTNTSAACVTQVQARAFNKFWYGQTPDGSVPAPAQDNGFAATTAASQRWYGLARGTNLQALAGPTPFTIASDLVALELQDPTIATPTFMNARGNGNNGWRNLSYAQLDAAWQAGLALQPAFANINTDNPDLSAFRARRGKILMYHGLADVLIPPQGSIHYYERVASQMGGLAQVQDFFRFYLVPGMAHGFSNGSAVATADPPLPNNAMLYNLLVDWVENGRAPGRVDITATPPSVRSRPICPYPLKATYTGGPATTSAGYACQ